jgi:hypothetical protein
MDLTDVEPGDIFVTATQLDPAARFPTGHGRIRHYDRNWRVKRDIDTGAYGLISALVFDRTGTLHALDPQARRIDHFGPQTMAALPTRAYGSMIELRDGHFLLGEHMIGKTPGFEGEGKTYLVDGAGNVHATFDTETNGGVSGFLGVTHISVSADEKTLYHVSDTGAHIYAHDLAAKKRLGAIYTRADPPPMVFDVAALPDGDLLVAIGGGVRRLDGDRKPVRDYAMPAGRGWSVVILREDGASFWALDFFGGQLAIVDTASGDIRLHNQLGLEKALAGLAEVPADWKSKPR